MKDFFDKRFHEEREREREREWDEENVITFMIPFYFLRCSNITILSLSRSHSFIILQLYVSFSGWIIFSCFGWRCTFPCGKKKGVEEEKNWINEFSSHPVHEITIPGHSKRGKRGRRREKRWMGKGMGRDLCMLWVTSGPTTNFLFFSVSPSLLHRPTADDPAAPVSLSPSLTRH